MSDAAGTMADEDELQRAFDLLGDLALAGELALDALLQRIVDAARALLRARYAALGVFDAQGRVREFITAGLTAEERAAIGSPPIGAGLLGLIVRERRIVRAGRIACHPASVGFPAHHPPMTSFLGGPIALGGKIFGNLYLTDRLDAAEFTARDEKVLAVFARQAAIAIENAGRLARAQREEQTIRALFEIGRALASLSDPDAVLALVVREARRLLEADLAAVGLRQPGGDALRWVVVQDGAGARRFDQAVSLRTTLAGRAIAEGRVFRADDLHHLGDVLPANPLLREADVRSLLLAPLGDRGDARGTLLVGWRVAGAIPDGAERVLERLADRAAIALAQAELHARERAALRQAEVERSSLEAIFDSLEDAVVTADLADAITRLNRRAAAWAGLAGAEARGRAIAELFPLVDAVGRPVAAAGDEERAGDEVFLRRRVGDPIPVQPAHSPIRDERGAALGSVLVLRDLRARRQVEQLKANIISLVSHELRTPLAHIKGYASTLLQPDVEWDAETQRDFIQSIERQADRLGRLIGDLLEISRLDAGGAAQLERSAVAPKTLIERGLRQADPAAAGHPIAVDAPADLPPVSADPGHIERVLSNLIENAAKYSPAGAPIAVAAATQDGAVAFSVRDQGGGLTEEERGHLFERFYRSPRVKHRTPGTGLGLAICKEIVEAHGGAITVESAEDAGSTFRFTLPLAAAGDQGRGTE